jgi:MSHA biogenesis protein MshN
LSEAQKLLEEGRRLVPGHYRFAQLLARLYVQRGVDEKGLALLEQVQDDAQEDAGFLGLLAVLYQRAGRHQEAIENYTRAVILDPGQSQWWVALGISLEAEQRWGAAYSAYFRALGGQQLERNLVRYTKQRLALLRPRVANADTAKVPAVAARSEESHTAN